MAKDKDEVKDPLLDDENDTDTSNEGSESEESSDKGSDEKPEKKPAATRSTVKADKPAAPAPRQNVQDELLGDAKRTQLALAKAPKIMFLVPLSPFEKEGAYDEVYINGYRTTVKKGVMVEIPRPVAELLAQKYNIEMTAGQEHRIDRDNRVEDALS